MFNYNLFNYFVYNQFGGRKNNEAKWETFSHNGVLFPEPYIPHKVPLIYDGEKIILDPESEEYATIYAKFTNTDYVKNKIFNKNFFNDWKYYLKKGGFNQIKELEKCDFSLILNYILENKEAKKNISNEVKLKEKKMKDDLENKFKTALVDGKIQDVGNFRIEPPGIFLGRGCHPKAGKIKKRIFPEEIVINIDTKAQIPEMPSFYKNHKWKKIIHDNTLEWLASWKDDITGKIKYVWLGSKSDFKAKSDQNKFDTARKLNGLIGAFRRNNINNLSSTSTDEKTKQLACALYFIDNLALRVGNEKGEDEADTVGVCSLRVEHIQLLDDDKIKLDFLGKDSVRFQKTIKVEKVVYDNLINFIKGKKPKDDLFDLINPTLLNNYLKSMMEDLTAKVFRTYNASKLFQDELDKINLTIDNIKEDKLDDIKEHHEKEEKKHNENKKINLILDLYNKANIKVALLCNHQKNVSKNFNDQITKMDEKIKNLKNKKKSVEDEKKSIDDKEKIKKLNEKLNLIQNQIKDANNRKELKMEMKNLSLTTSKINYIDPRITISFFKKHNLPLEKIFSQALIDKFFWAMDVDENWKF